MNKYLYLFFCSVVTFSCWNNKENINVNTGTEENINANAKTEENINVNAKTEKNISTNVETENNGTSNNNSVNGVNNNSENNIINPDDCLSPLFYAEFEESWIRETDYLNRPVCGYNNIGFVHSMDKSIYLSQSLCQQHDDCIFPAIDDENRKTEVATIVGDIGIVRYEGENDFDMVLDLYDLSGQYKIGYMLLGEDIYSLKAHKPKRNLIGKKLTFINFHSSYFLPNDHYEQSVGSPFIIDSSNNLIFGSITKDNINEEYSIYNKFLSDYFEMESFSENNVLYDVCFDDSNIDDTCFAQKRSDLKIISNDGNYIIPWRTEGDFWVNGIRYGAFLTQYDKKTSDLCNTDNNYNNEEVSFYFFNRDYFEGNPDFIPSPECNQE